MNTIEKQNIWIAIEGN